MNQITVRDYLDREAAGIRKEAIEDAIRAVETVRMPKSGDGPVLLLDVKAEIIAAIRRVA